jgi:hypothetical protein
MRLEAFLFPLGITENVVDKYKIKNIIFDSVGKTGKE